MTKTIIRSFAVLFVILFVATACGGDGGNGDDIATLELEINNLEERIELLEGKSGVEAVSNQESALASDSTTTTSYPRLERMEEIDSMTLEQCMALDHHAYLGLDDPKVTPQGAFFNYDCQTGYWGWYFEGAASDKWQARQVTPEDFPEGVDQMAFPLEFLNPPLDRQHPEFSEALTLRELKSMVNDPASHHIVCVRNSPAEGEIEGDTRVYQVTNVYSFAHLLAYDTPYVVAYPAFDFKTLGEDHVNTWSLEEMGVIPWENGLWSTAHLTEGNCD